MNMFPYASIIIHCPGVLPNLVRIRGEFITYNLNGFERLGTQDLKTKQVTF